MRKQNAVLDVVLEMFADDMLFPTIEQASKRSGLSLRTLYRYFADPGELVEATITRSRERVAELGHLPHIGKGPLNERLDDFVAIRVRLYETIGPMYRATLHNAATHARVRDELLENRQQFRAQIELQFAPELAAMSPRERSSVIEAGDILSQMDSISLLRRYRNLTAPETEVVLRDGLAALFRSEAVGG